MSSLLPDVASRSQIWRPGTGQDPARRLIPDSQLFYPRPSIQSGNKKFTWPVGVEGFRSSGAAQLAIHRYLGENAVEVNVTHLDEHRLELTGTFPGRTSRANMVALRDIIMNKAPERGKILTLPGVFEEVKYVAIENYDFTHDRDDRSHSIDYTISFVVMGTGKKIKPRKGVPPAPQPTVKGANRGQPARYFVARDGGRTFRQVAKLKYGDDDQWRKLVQLNQQLISKATSKGTITSAQVPNYRWPIGTKIRY